MFSWIYSVIKRFLYTFLLVKTGGGVMKLVYSSLLSFYMAFFVIFQ